MRRTWLNLLTAVAIASTLGSAMFVLGFRVSSPAQVLGFDRVVAAAEELRDRAARPVSDRELVDAAIRGMLEALHDPYASLLDPAQRAEIDQLTRGSIIGVGLWLDAGPEGLLVTSVIPGGPAEKAGVRGGDVIVSVDGTSVRGADLQDASQLLKGAEGTSVDAVLVRSGRRLALSMQRARVEVTDVTSRLLPRRVGYVRLYEFGIGVSGQLRSAVQQLISEGATGLVLDLRDNPGGLADEAFRSASVFVADGQVAIIRERGKADRPVYASGDPVRAVPLVLIVNGGTASASEILAGALRDRMGAALVGQRTFGKGSVLSVESPGGGPSIQYTSAFFLTPDGHEVEGRGLAPDVLVSPGGPGDKQLRRAVRVLLAGSSR